VTGFNPSKKARIPKLRHHKSSGRAVATFNKRDIYFGHYGTSEAAQRYHRYVAEWEANDRQPPIPKGDDVTITELAAAFLKHAKTHHRRPDGTPTSRIYTVTSTLRPLEGLYGDTPIAEFGPRAFAACRQSWIDQGMTRQTVNDYAATLRGIFKWGVAQELVPETVYRALLAVPGIRVGRTEARENKTRKPVHQADIDAVKPYVTRAVWGLIRLQLLTGARGGELVGLKPTDIDMTGKIWIAKLDQHKTAWKAKSRELLFGPAAQEVISEFLPGRPVNAPLFNPREALRETAELRRTGPGRRPNQKPNPRKTARTMGSTYTAASYGRAIKRACELVHIDPPWTPHQLRHAAASRLRKEFGIELARIVLGHSSAITTENYAEADRKKAFSAVGKIG
jgi:integrase